MVDLTKPLEMFVDDKYVPCTLVDSTEDEAVLKYWDGSSYAFYIHSSDDYTNALRNVVQETWAVLCAASKFFSKEDAQNWADRANKDFGLEGVYQVFKVVDDNTSGTE